jgi:ketosteroid isomerase-like protein
MKRFLETAFAIVFFVALVSAPLFAQSAASPDSTAKQDVSGKWSGSFDITGPDGSAQHDTAVLILKQDGSAITGSAGPSEDQQMPIKSGKIDGQAIDLKVEADGLSMHFLLRLDGDHLKGEANEETPGGKISAKVDVVRAGAKARPSPSEALFKEISDMDSVLFGAYNRRDLKTMATLFTEDLEFYHDKGGLSTYQQNMDSFKKTFESATTVRRELVPGTLEVYPLKGYGAVEIGVHRFYTTEPGQKEKLTATAKFVHVWQKKDGWKISRVVSYDHR